MFLGVVGKPEKQEETQRNMDIRRTCATHNGLLPKHIIIIYYSLLVVLSDTSDLVSYAAFLRNRHDF